MEWGLTTTVAKYADDRKTGSGMISGNDARGQQNYLEKLENHRGEQSTQRPPRSPQAQPTDTSLDIIFVSVTTENHCFWYIPTTKMLVFAQSYAHLQSDLMD